MATFQNVILDFRFCRFIVASLALKSPTKNIKSNQIWDPVVQIVMNKAIFRASPEWRRALPISIETIAEYHPIEPHERGCTWRPSKSATEYKDWKTHLERRKGIYIFYDSTGSVTYIGQTKKCLLTEIDQRLDAPLRGTRYWWNMKKSSTNSNRLAQGDIARMISVYEIKDEDAIHNIEVIMIRGLMNDHLNNCVENFES